MDLSNLPAIITAVIVLAFLVFTGIRLGAQFLVRRLAGLLFVILGVTFITFILGYFAPGDAVIAQLGQHYSDPERSCAAPLIWPRPPWYNAVRELFVSPAAL